MRNLLYTIRVLLRNKFYSFLNILGLAMGLAASIIIFLYVQSDLNYDKSHENWEQIYRIESRYTINGKDDEFALSSPALIELMSEEYPEILRFTRFTNIGQVLFRIADNNFYVDDVYFADSTVFNVFTHDFLQGNPETALDEPNTIVLTETTAKKLFGSQDPMNEIVKTDNNSYTVTGIIADLPDNLHLTYNALVSYATITSNQPQLTQQQKTSSLWGIQLYSYVVLPKHYDLNNIYDKFPDFFKKYMEPITQIAPSLRGATFEPRFVPLNEVHFNSRVQYDLPTGNKAYTRAFMAIGLFVLTLASINYMNMATAKATQRSREVGIRKVLGSTRAGLIKQFMSESFVITVFSLITAILICYLLIHGTSLNTLLDKQLELDFINNRLLLFGSLGITLLVGLLSGIYPAFYLSTISMLTAMKGAVRTGPGSLFLRRILVTFQFLISIGVVISTILMSNQINYMRTMDLGFNKDNVIIIPTRDTLVSSKLEIIQNELLENPNILNVTTSTGIGISRANAVGNRLIGGGRQLFLVEDADSIMASDTYNVMYVGKNFINTMQIEIVDGADFDESKPTDLTNGVLVNETLVAKMGWEDPLGKKVSNAGPNQVPLKVIGVVKDFNAFSLHVKVEPMIIFRYERLGPTARIRPAMLVHSKAGQLKQTIDYLENKYEILDPSHPFEYGLLDQQAELLYAADNRQSKLTTIVSYICIIISCLGLLGLASYTTATRIKEIGVRKVLGASIYQLVFMVFKNVMILVIVGFIIAAPIAYLQVKNWIQVFEYTMNLPRMMIMASCIALVLSLLIAFVTVGFHSITAAKRNPVNALRTE